MQKWMVEFFSRYKLRCYAFGYAVRVYIHAQFLCSVLAQSLAMSSTVTFETIINPSRNIAYSLVIMNIQLYDIVHMFHSMTCFIYMYDNISTIIQ